jgi:hypothetical protein
MRVIARLSYIPIIGIAGWVLAGESTWMDAALVALLVMVGDWIAEYAFTGSIQDIFRRHRAERPNDA